MKIVVAALSEPAHLNGVSRHSANLVKGLLTRGAVTEVHMLVGTWQQKTYEDAVARADVRLHIHPVNVGRGTISRNLWYYSELPRIARQLDADVVHLAYPVPISPKAFHCSVVVSLHDLYAFDSTANFSIAKGLVNRLVARQCLRSADAIACVSESTRERLRQRLGQKLAMRAVTVLNGVEPLSMVAARPPRALRGCDSFILCIAQHRHNKNISLAIKVFDRVLRTGVVSSEARFVVIGVPGPETGSIERQIREARLEQKVLLLTGISDSELQWCYRNCELLLAPSTIEGFGLPVVEALQAGCKTVCSDIPAFREVGGDGCDYVSLGQGEVDGFVIAIQKSLNSPRRMPVSMPWLAVEAIAEKYIALYRRLLTRAVSPDLGTSLNPHTGGQNGG
jgi:glycosyltransferase involved in cell wall biosynthesis